MAEKLTSDDDGRNSSPAAKPGLGDLAEQFFRSLGITEERYKAVKVALHLDPKCNCGIVGGGSTRWARSWASMAW